LLQSNPFCRAARRRSAGQAGFTIVELLVVTLVAGIVSVAVLAAYTSLSGTFNSQDVRIQNQDDARTAMNQITRFIRMATSSASNKTTQSNSVAIASPQNLEFYCDVDGDNLAEKVRYYLNGSTLMMQRAEPVAIAAYPYYQYNSYDTNGIVVQSAIRNGTAPVFGYSYYNPNLYGTGVGGLVAFTPNNAVPADLQKIVAVSVSLTVNEKPAIARGNVVLATNVQIRQRYNGGLVK
jgi:prepilin-type N-terminal cleavage/methylation domain-containing protein